MIRFLQAAVGRRPTLIFWGFLVALTGAEALTALADTRWGLGLHALLLLGLLALSATVRGEAERRLALALTLAPLIRLLSLALPLTRLPQMAWYVLVALPLFAATRLIVREGRVSRRELGLVAGPVAIELMLMLFGIGLGVAEYLILQPKALAAEPTVAFFVLSALSLFVFTGFLEELIFRGLLQTLSAPVLGRWALIYVSLLFGALHIGHLSLLDVLFVSLIGLLFAHFVRWGKSILGVTLAHGLTNTTLFLLAPLVEQRAPGAIARLAPATLLLSGVLMAAIGWMLFWYNALERERIDAAAPRNGLRAARRELGLSYTELAQRSGLPVRALIEAEYSREHAGREMAARIVAALRANQEGPMQSEA